MRYCNIMKSVILHNDMYISHLYYTAYILYRVFYTALYYTVL